MELLVVAIICMVVLAVANTRLRSIPRKLLRDRKARAEWRRIMSEDPDLRKLFEVDKP
jgi:hypothetical protein